MSLKIDDMATFCKAKGFVFPNSDIYGGYSGFYDYGPLGVELKNNIKNSWWKRFVQSREDVVGIDGATISNPNLWKASGHVSSFSDNMIYCKKNKKQFRADVLVEEVLDMNVEGKSKGDIVALIRKNQDRFVKAGYDLVDEISDFNLMFKTYVGPQQSEDSVSYLRPETAQLIFANFKTVFDTMRQKLPFGIAQIGRAFRNEISPRDFLFRCREFEQMEIEFFIHPKESAKNPNFSQDDLNYKFNILNASAQEKGSNQHNSIKVKDLIKTLDSWHVYWLLQTYEWFIDLGIRPENLRLREHMKDELAHYSKACFDIEYKFPFGWKEIHGCADRGQFDLMQHNKHSKEKMEIFDEESKEKIIPRVIEPSQGLDRAFLALMFDAYDDDKERGNIVLHIEPKLAPVKVGIFPLVNKLRDETREVFSMLKDDLNIFFDSSGSIGRRYARADERGIPFCVTYDFDSRDDKSVTVRNRDTTEQIRVRIDELKEYLKEKIE
jgi:glycyl-tRNA synthetase